MAREDRNVPPGVLKPTSDIVTPMFSTQDWIRVEYESRKRQKSPNLVAAGSKPQGATRSGGQDKRSIPLGTTPEDLWGREQNPQMPRCLPLVSGWP